MAKFLHERKDFNDLLRIVADERSLDPVLAEKDYWIMHCLWGLQQQNFHFELKGGTSLSKGFGVIHRFSEDIDIRIDPPEGSDVKVGHNQNKPAHVASRAQFYEGVAQHIKIPGIEQVQRDKSFDDEKMRSAGIRLSYSSHFTPLEGVKEGILLELGFDDTTPNRPVTVSSWAWDTAHERGVDIIDNRAVDVLCYLPTHTFVEKLQTISTKYRRLGEMPEFPRNFLRHYYDVYCLLQLVEVQDFMHTPAYPERKAKRFRTGDEQTISKNPAFQLEDATQRDLFESEYRKSAALYYQGQPEFKHVLARIHQHLASM
ncbi:MAG: nucleotidyl transferase AbiEii/AbiGii toxin family protein [Burkholderiaceae bacterium]